MLYALAAWNAVKGVAARIPWQALVAVALLIAIPVNGCIQHRNGVSEGREAVLAELRAAEAEAAEKALHAIAEAGAGGVERAEKFEAVQEGLREAIKEAEANDTNSLDALF